jgi:hypothetical protein
MSLELLWCPCHTCVMCLPSGKIHSVIVKWLRMSAQSFIVYMSEVCSLVKLLSQTIR